MKTWLITGISRGLGRSLAQAALARGDTVVGTVRSGAPDLAGPGRLHVVTADLAEPGQADEVVAQAFAATGRVDVVVNNAGYGLLGAIETATDEEIARLFAVDVFAPFRIIRASLPRLRAQGAGHIVNITSIAGRAPGPGAGLYAAAKHALEGLSVALAQEVAPLGLKVTAVAPGAFRTDFLSDHSIRRSTPEDAAYADSVGRSATAFAGMAGRQAGDPDRAALAILAAVDAANPPRQLLLGPDALARLRAREAEARAEIEAWQAVTLGTDHK